MKKTNTNTKTKTKPVVYDFNSCITVFDAYAVIPTTKFFISKDFTNLERDTFINFIADEAYDWYIIHLNTQLNKNGGTKIFVNEFDTLDEIMKFVSGEKKPNIFKRFWNWITRKK